RRPRAPHPPATNTICLSPPPPPPDPRGDCVCPPVDRGFGLQGERRCPSTTFEVSPSPLRCSSSRWLFARCPSASSFSVASGAPPAPSCCGSSSSPLPNNDRDQVCIAPPSSQLGPNTIGINAKNCFGQYGATFHHPLMGRVRASSHLRNGTKKKKIHGIMRPALTS